MKFTGTKINPIGLHRIWKEAFDEKDDYIALFFDEALPLGKVLTCGPVHAPIAALYLFPIHLQLAKKSYSGYYLYALGVLQAQRGKGYGSLLMQQAHEFAHLNKGAFILLQPTHTSLFDYYQRLGYTYTLSRTFLRCNRTTLQNADSNLFYLLASRSAPDTNRFTWSEPMRQYILKECLFRGGALTGQTAYSYPQQDESGIFVEIKEFNCSAQEIPHLFHRLLHHFPQANRFVFYGKVTNTPSDHPQLTSFALLHFLDPEAEALYHINQPVYFALGLD